MNEVIESVKKRLKVLEEMKARFTETLDNREGIAKEMLSLEVMKCEVLIQELNELLEYMIMVERKV